MKTLFIFSLLALLTSVGCSKSSETAPAAVSNPPQAAPPVGTNIGSTEDQDQNQEEQEEEELPTRDGGSDIGSSTNNEDNTEDDIEVTEIGPNDPCYEFMNHQASRPVANCVKMVNGRVSSKYPNIAKFGRACLLKSSYDNGITIFSLIGSFIEVDGSSNRVVHRLDGFKDTPIENDRVKFDYKDEELKTSVTYDLVSEELSIKQVTKTFKKRVRFFKLGCTPVHDIR